MTARGVYILCPTYIENYRQSISEYSKRAFAGTGGIISEVRSVFNEKYEEAKTCREYLEGALSEAEALQSIAESKLSEATRKLSELERNEPPKTIREKYENENGEVIERIVPNPEHDKWEADVCACARKVEYCKDVCASIKVELDLIKKDLSNAQNAVRECYECIQSINELERAIDGYERQLQKETKETEMQLNNTLRIVREIFELKSEYFKAIPSSEQIRVNVDSVKRCIESFCSTLSSYTRMMREMRIELTDIGHVWSDSVYDESIEVAECVYENFEKTIEAYTSIIAFLRTEMSMIDEYYRSSKRS